jgi:hypothetical protein
MCIFQYSKEVEKHQLKKDEALIGYRSMYLGGNGFTSPIKHTSWRGRFFYHPNGIAGAKFRRLSLIRGKKSGRLVRAVPGIHCMKTKTAAIREGSSGSVIVEVKMWGTVYEYAANKDHGYVSGPAGYLAQNCEIVALTNINAGWYAVDAYTRSWYWNKFKKYKGKIADKRSPSAKKRIPLPL